MLLANENSHCRFPSTASQQLISTEYQTNPRIYTEKKLLPSNKNELGFKATYLPVLGWNDLPLTLGTFI